MIVDNVCCQAYTEGRQQNAVKTPSPRVAPGGGGPTSDLTGPRGESPANTSWRRAYPSARIRQLTPQAPKKEVSRCPRSCPQPVRRASAPLPRGARDERVRRSEERRVGKECRSRWSQYH